MEGFHLPHGVRAGAPLLQAKRRADESVPLPSQQAVEGCGDAAAERRLVDGLETRLGVSGRRPNRQSQRLLHGRGRSISEDLLGDISVDGLLEGLNNAWVGRVGLAGAFPRRIKKKKAITRSGPG